jgi:hypothetical protein
MTIVYVLSGTQLCGSVRNARKFTIKPTHSTVVKGYEKADQSRQVDHFHPWLNFISNLLALVPEGGGVMYKGLGTSVLYITTT